MFFFFSTSIPIVVFYVIFDMCQSHWCKLISHCHFDLHGPDDKWWEAFLIYLLAVCVAILRKCLFTLFFDGVVWYLGCYFTSDLYILDIDFFCQMSNDKYFFPVCELSVNSSHCFFPVHLNLISSHLFIFSFIFLANWSTWFPTFTPYPSLHQLPIPLPDSTTKSQ